MEGKPHSAVVLLNRSEVMFARNSGMDLFTESRPMIAASISRQKGVSTMSNLPSDKLN